MTCPYTRLASVAIASDIYVFWQDNSNGIQYFHYNATGSFTSTQLVAPSSTINPMPGTGLACVGWNDTQYHLRCYFQNYVDGSIMQISQDGKTSPWSTPTIVTVNARNYTRIGACFYNSGSSDSVNLFFQNHTDASNMSQYQSMDGGNTWTALSTWTCSANLLNGCDIAAVFTPPTGPYNAMLQVVFQDTSYNIVINQYDLTLNTWSNGVVRNGLVAVVSIGFVSLASTPKDLKIYYSQPQSSGSGYIIDFINNSNGAPGYWGNGTLPMYSNSANITAGFTAASTGSTIYMFYLNYTTGAILNSNSIYILKWTSGTYSGAIAALNNYTCAFQIFPSGPNYEMQFTLPYKTSTTYTLTDTNCTNPTNAPVQLMPMNYIMYVNPDVIVGSCTYQVYTDQFQGGHMSIMQGSTNIGDAYANPLKSVFLHVTTYSGSGNWSP